MVRRQLLQRIIPPPAREAPVVIALTAPAGFGKTTLASQVLSELNNRSYLWRAMDEQDSDPGLLLHDFIRGLHSPAVHRADRILLVEQLPLLPLSSDDIRRVVTMVHRFLSSISEPQRVTLVLDDLHRLDRAPLSRLALQGLLETLPHWIDIVFISRTAGAQAFIPRRDIILRQINRSDLLFSPEERTELAELVKPLHVQEPALTSMHPADTG